MVFSLSRIFFGVRLTLNEWKVLQEKDGKWGAAVSNRQNHHPCIILLQYACAYMQCLNLYPNAWLVKKEKGDVSAEDYLLEIPVVTKTMIYRTNQRTGQIKNMIILLTLVVICLLVYGLGRYTNERFK